MLKTLKIQGGPGPTTIRVTDAETGEPITDKIRELTIRVSGEKLVQADVVMFSKVDVVAEAEIRPRLIVQLAALYDRARSLCNDLEALMQRFGAERLESTEG